MGKRIVLFALLLAVAMSAGAQKVTLYVAFSVDIDAPSETYWINPFRVENPNVKLVWVPIGIADASTMGMDARIASGLPVHFYWDYMSRAAKYAIPKSAGGSIAALDLSKYLKDLDDFLPGMLESYRRDGQLLAVPGPMLLIGQQLNLTLMAKAGYVPPKQSAWSLAEFEKMAEKVKAAKTPDTFPTLMFAENRSGDWMYMGWLASFGAQVLKDGKLAIAPNEPRGLEVFKYWKRLLDMGWIPPEAAMMNDDHAIAYRDEGRLAAMGARAGSWELSDKALLAQGVMKEIPKRVLYPYPRAPGVAKAPIMATYELVIAFDTGTEAEKAMAARLVWHNTNTASQQFIVDSIGAKYPSRKSVKFSTLGYWLEANALLQEHGTLDVGGAQQNYDGIRGAMFPQLQRLFSGKASPVEAYAGYIAEVQRVLDATK